MTEELTTPAPLQGEDLLLACRKDPQKYRRLSRIPRPEAESTMAKIVMKAMLYRGQRADTDTVAFISSSLLDELQRNEYGVWYLSFEEVEWLFRSTVLHSTDFYISVSSLYSVLVDYAKGLGNQLQRRVEKEKLAAKDKALKESVVGTMMASMAVDINDKLKTN